MLCAYKSTVLMQSEIPLCLRSSASLVQHVQCRQMSFKNTTKAQSLRRSVELIVCRTAVKWSLKVFGNISENKFTLINAILLKLHFLRWVRKCTKWVENGLTKIRRIWPSRSKSKKAHTLILTWCFPWRFSRCLVFVFRRMLFLELRKFSVS